MEQVYKKLEVVGSSKTGIESAIANALERVSRVSGTMRWFEVKEVRGYIEENMVSYFQVTLKVGFSLAEDEKF